MIYLNGEGVARDVNEAARLTQLSAAQGHGHAEVNLGTMYLNGHGVKQSDTEATRLYRKGAAKGIPQGLESLAVCHAEGRGVPQSQDEAMRLMRAAAEIGYPPAQYYLGAVYKNAPGYSIRAPLDYAEAAKWFRMAAENSAVAFRMAETSALNNPVTSSQCNLGCLYANGQGVAKDPEEALKWFRRAADHGYAEAQNLLGLMHQNGSDGLQQSATHAVSWYRKAAEQGFAQAQFSLGIMYGGGMGIARDLAQSTWWLNLAGAQGCLEANGFALVAENRSVDSCAGDANAGDANLAGKRCANTDCRAPGPTVRCSRCKAARYCDKACQRQHWTHQGHKVDCVRRLVIP